MGIRKYKPTTPGLRGMTVSTFEEITTSTPEKSLTVLLRSTQEETTEVKSLSDIRAAAPDRNTELSTSREIRTIFREQ